MKKTNVVKFLTNLKGGIRIDCIVEPNEETEKSIISIFIQSPDPNFPGMHFIMNKDQAKEFADVISQSVVYVESLKNNKH